MKIAVVALGKIGLPLAVQFAGKGHEVHGADIDPAVVAAVNDGREPFPGEAELGQRLREVVSDGRLTATTDVTAAVAGSEVVVVVVPLFASDGGEPDFASMDQATLDIAAGLRAGALVSYETTLPVGTTRSRFAPMLEAGSGLRVGEDLHVAFSPERVFSGRVFADLRRYPKLVGGLDARGAAAAARFYEAVLDFDQRDDLARDNGVWDLGSAEAAELVKLAETTYRDVNIGLANQFAIFADSQGVDVNQVIEAANSQPFSHIHRPGVAVGGHCIPIYPRFYLWNHPEATIVRAAREQNAAMPAYAVGLLAADLERRRRTLAGSRVVVLGAAYRGGVKEAAFSGVFGTVEALLAAGAVPLVHDPLYSQDELRSLDLVPYSLGEPVDAAIIQTDHSDYAKLGPDDLPGVQAVVDGRDIADPALWPQGMLRVLGRGRA